MVRVVHGGVVLLSLGGVAFDFVFLEQSVRAVWFEDFRADDRVGVDLRYVGDAVGEDFQVFSRTGEVEQSEKSSHVCQPGRGGGRAGRGLVHSFPDERDV